ncbi:ArsR/SmtB family transcription factor [Dictyobacter aurantiacus]|uniref:HTH arsR-type domain-containing protein n=1 Tax=Dictyobacter aurantiacus TaxID=1936993 RepID=A0A401ZCB2_9CHLR|nr:metalloregulator ArsR/SmtB family transcription factor [Dictyobacter aurantiacus]GCE04472.1 hypothetical protein KDAU_18010 [Dictyobacter aurantiacus]
MVESSSTNHQEQNRAPRRPAEVDKYVDTFLGVVCDPSRRYILELLSFTDSREDKQMPEMRSGEIARAIGLSAATTSEHLRQLTTIGLISWRREGNVVYYQLRNRELVAAFHKLMEALDNDYALKKEM